MVRSGPPKQLLLQWHITDRCNLRCRHCYQNDYRGPGPDFRHLLGILDQYEMLLGALGGNGKRIPGQINITGGEPFVRKDFLELLKEIRRRGIPFAILSNGSLLDQATARFLETLAPRFVQLSLEGGEAMHNAIRGKGDYARVVGSLRLLKKAGIRTLVSFTAHRENFRDFPAVADQCRRIGVDRLWSDRLIPEPAGNGSGPETLSQDETKELFSVMATESTRRGILRRRSPIAMHRALQFLVTGERPYRCNAGFGLITVMPDGTVLPCRRLPISAGNLFQTSLTKIYVESTLLRRLRDPSLIGKCCESCVHAAGCRGGLRCLAYALSGDPFRADPGCWLIPTAATATATSASTSAAATTATAIRTP